MPAGRARFDPDLRAWILSRHEDVSAALREARLVADDGREGSGAHRAVRGAVAQSLSAGRLSAWRPDFERSAHEMAARLPADRTVDLLASFAAPWSLSLAVTVTGADPTDGEALASLAREVFLWSAARTKVDPGPAAGLAAAELARRLPAADATINVQAFVALSQTLPQLLAGTWLALFSDQEAALRLRVEPDLLPVAMEELLRHAGPSRAIFRIALADLRVGEARIASGDRVILMLAAANHDPERFDGPDDVDFQRASGEHFVFGGGLHACSGARLVRMAAGIATDALLRTADAVELTGRVDWIDGFAIRAPASLPAVLRRAPAALQPDLESTAGWYPDPGR